jgi:cytochrome c peroxidase
VGQGAVPVPAVLSSASHSTRPSHPPTAGAPERSPWTFGRNALLAVTFLAAGCSNADETRDGVPILDGADAAMDAAESPPVLTTQQKAALRALSPDVLPTPPADPTNRFADDPNAALLGQRLFYDRSFSGQLLDTDNDGTPQTLGIATPTSGQTGRVACAGCHIPASGFSDTRSFQRQISLGAGWGRRRAPSLLDVGQAKLLMWDGRKDSLFSQIFGPLETVVEMNSSRLYMAEQLYERYKSDYEAIFGPMPPLEDATQFPLLAADVTGCIPKNRADPPPVCDGPFHGMPGDDAEFDGMTSANQTAVTAVVANAGKAIGAFERLLSCGAGPFDAWVHGDVSAISNAAQRGAVLFVGKGGCVTCHSGPFLSDQKFHNVGLIPMVVQQAFIDSDDQGEATGLPQLLASPLNSIGAFSDGSDGRIPTKVTPAMQGAFRTPTLRCVTMRPTFMHTGQIGTLQDVIGFFNEGGDSVGKDPGEYPGTNELHPLGLSSLDQSDLVSFLQTLEGPGAPAALRAPPTK